MYSSPINRTNSDQITFIKFELSNRSQNIHLQPMFLYNWKINLSFALRTCDEHHWMKCNGNDLFFNSTIKTTNQRRMK